MKKKPITVWYLERDGEVSFNHIEDGHSELDYPSPKSKARSSNYWKNMKWTKKHTYLEDPGTGQHAPAPLVKE